MYIIIQNADIAIHTTITKTVSTYSVGRISSAVGPISQYCITSPVLLIVPLIQLKKHRATRCYAIGAFEHKVLQGCCYLLLPSFERQDLQLLPGKYFE